MLQPGEEKEKGSIIIMLPGGEEKEKGSLFSSESLQMPGRQRFSVELRTGETTVISWKKLVKDLHKSTAAASPPAGAHPALEARIAPEAYTGDSQLEKDGLPPPANRFSAVIEKIERLYKGTPSSDEEELNDILDDDQYDTDDSFIDDEELDEYFSVDKSKTRHRGFFINRGKLERVNEPAPSPAHVPRKRKKRDIKRIPGDKFIEDVPKKLLKVGGVRMKAAARHAPLTGVNGADSGQSRKIFRGNESSIDKISEDRDVILMQNQASTFGSVPSKADKYKENINNETSSLSVKALHKHVAKTTTNKDEGKVSGLFGSRNSLVKGGKLVESTDKRDSSRSEKNISLTTDSQTRKNNKDASETVTANKFKTTEKVGKGADSLDVNSSGSKLLHSKKGDQNRGLKIAKQRKKLLTSTPKEGSPGRPKGSMLERALQELEKSVAELRPPTMDIQEQEGSSQSVKRRLPAVVRRKLAKVAILATNQGKLSDELIYRLMGIVGHIIQLKTLKRNLKDMIEVEKSAKQEKECRLQDIKREVSKMVKMQVSSEKSKMAEQQEGSSDDFQAVPASAEKGTSRACYKWDNAIEDLLCELYDEYIEGMNVNKSSQVKKFYGEVAELWPKGCMDNSGIKHAVYRAKERKKILNKGLEKSKKKKVPVKPKMDGSNGNGNIVNESDVNFQNPASHDKQIELQRDHIISVNQGNTFQSKAAKVKSHSCTDEKRKYVKKSIRKEFNNVKQWNSKETATVFKKKMKRKSDIGTGSPSTPIVKVTSIHGKEMHKVGKQVLHGNSIRNKGSPQVVGIPSCTSVKSG